MKNRMFLLTVCELISCTALALCLSLLIMIFAYNFDVTREVSKLPASCEREIESWSVNQTSHEEMAKAHFGGSHAAFGKNIIGLTVVKDKAILLSSLDYEAKMAFVHEIGHACDVNNGYPSTTPEFYEIYLQEASGYGATDTYEFFAEVYQDIAKGHPSKKTPLANEYVAQFIGD